MHKMINGININQIIDKKVSHMFDLMFTCHKDPIDFFKYVWNESGIVDPDLFKNEYKEMSNYFNYKQYHILLSFAKHGSYKCLNYLHDLHISKKIFVCDFVSLNTICEGLKNSGKKGFLNTFVYLHNLYVHTLENTYLNQNNIDQFEYKTQLESFKHGDVNESLIVNVLEGLINDKTCTRGHNILVFLSNNGHSFEFIDNDKINMLKYNNKNDIRLDVYNTVISKIHKEKKSILLKALKDKLSETILSMMKLGIELNECLRIFEETHKNDNDALKIIAELRYKFSN